MCIFIWCSVLFTLILREKQVLVILDDYEQILFDSDYNKREAVSFIEN